MKTLAVIPARLDATRLPRKPLRLIAGVPLIVRVMERVLALRVSDRVIVATDSLEIATRVSQAGGEAVMTSNEHLSGTDRVAEVARMAAFSGVDVILNVQGDEPFVSAPAVRGALEKVTSQAFSLGTAAVASATTILSRPDLVKVVVAYDGAAMYFSRAPIPFPRDAGVKGDAAALDGQLWRHVGVYAYTPDALARWVSLPVHPLERIEQLEQLRPLAAGMRLGVALVHGQARNGIDTVADLDQANKDWPTFLMNES